jgi:hypothetical protein
MLEQLVKLVFIPLPSFSFRRWLTSTKHFLTSGLLNKFMYPILPHATLLSAVAQGLARGIATDG